MESKYLKNVLLGSLIYFLLTLIATFFITYQGLLHSLLGLVLGYITNVGSFLWIKSAIDDQDLDDDRIVMRMMSLYGIRYFIYAIVFVAGFYFSIYSVFHAFVGIFATRMGIYYAQIKEDA